MFDKDTKEMNLDSSTSEEKKEEAVRTQDRIRAKVKDWNGIEEIRRWRERNRQ